MPAAADPVRVAVYSPALSRPGPGLVLAGLERGEDPQLEAALQVIARADADVLLLTDLDWDLRAETLAAVQDRLAALGVRYDHRFAPQPNTGIDTGFDIDGNGRLGEARDAQGYGHFTGQHGMALLSKLPIQADTARDFSARLWQDQPESQIAAAKLPTGAGAVQRLSSTAHWDVAVSTPQGPLHLWAYAATTPLFDGSEDRNGRRNADETAFWRHYLDGALPQKPAPGPFVILGLANLDPERGEGRPAALRALLSDPRLQDPKPTAPDAPGDAPFATAVFGEKTGALRLDYILPSAGLVVAGAGVDWADPAPVASKHRLLWLDLALR